MPAGATAQPIYFPRGNIPLGLWILSWVDAKLFAKQESSESKCAPLSVQGKALRGCAMAGLPSQSRQQEWRHDRKEKKSAAILLFSLNLGWTNVWRGSQCIGQFMLIYFHLPTDLCEPAEISVRNIDDVWRNSKVRKSKRSEQLCKKFPRKRKLIKESLKKKKDPRKLNLNIRPCA